MKIKIWLSIAILLHFKAFCQVKEEKKITFSGYAEPYYSFNFANPSTHEKEPFLYNHKRHNEFNLNLAFAKVAYLHHNIRTNFALMTGNYAHYNLSAEPLWAQFIYEANVGVKLSKTKNIWADVGILPSHIGFESATGSDCWTLTRSLLAENSPYFETGAKISYLNTIENLQLAFLVLNGWQRVQRPNAIQTPSAGIQINYKPKSNITLNYSNFVGTDKPDTANSIRTYHNLYAILQLNAKLGITLGFDIGTDKYNKTMYGAWYSPVLIAQYQLNQKNKVALRVEHFNDSKQIIITTNTPNGFQVLGASLNYDYQLHNNALWRAELKHYNAKDAIFITNNAAVTHSNFTFTTALCLKL